MPVELGEEYPNGASEYGVEDEFGKFLENENMEKIDRICGLKTIKEIKEQLKNYPELVDPQSYTYIQFEEQLEESIRRMINEGKKGTEENNRNIKEDIIVEIVKTILNEAYLKILENDRENNKNK